jgi:hypothetical protein
MIWFFADELSAVFAKTTKGNQSLVESAGYRSGNFSFRPLKPDDSSTAGNLLSTIFWPLYTPQNYTAKRHKKAEAAYFEAVVLPEK